MPDPIPKQEKTLTLPGLKGVTIKLKNDDYIPNAKITRQTGRGITFTTEDFPKGISIGRDRIDWIRDDPEGEREAKGHAEALHAKRKKVYQDMAHPNRYRSHLLYGEGKKMTLQEWDKFMEPLFKYYNFPLPKKSELRLRSPKLDSP